MPSPKAFALQELTACWDQGYEALVRGDLDQLSALLEIADEHVDPAQTAGADTPTEAALRQEASAARGRLEHGMRAGLEGLRDEMAKARIGRRAVQGYARAHHDGSAGKLVRDA